MALFKRKPQMEAARPPQMAAEAGMSYGRLCEKIVELALKK